MTSAEHALHDMLKRILSDADVHDWEDNPVAYAITYGTYVEAKALLEKIARGHYK